MGLRWLSVLAVPVLCTNLLAWPPAFEENITCTLPEDYVYRKSALVKLALPGFNSLFYNSVGLNASPETGNITGTFGAFYTQSFFVTPPTLFLSGYDAASSWSGLDSLDPIRANLSGSASFSAMEFQRISGQYANDTIAYMDLADFTWVMGEIHKDGDLSYVTFNGTSGNTTVRIDVCISDVLGRLNWGADISPTAVKTRFTVSGGFPEGGVKALNLSIGLATATLDAAAGVETSAGVFQLVRQGGKRMAHSVTFEGALQVACDGLLRAATLTTINGTIDSLLGPAIRTQLSTIVSHHLDVRVINVAFSAGQVTDTWVWDPTVASGMPPVRTTTPPSGGLTAGEIFGIIVLVLVVIGLLAVCVFHFRGRVQRAEKTALAHEGQKTYV